MGLHADMQKYFRILSLVSFSASICATISFMFIFIFIITLFVRSINIF
jgi:hypothetical protein